MTKKIILTVVALLLVLCLVFISCAPDLSNLDDDQYHTSIGSLDLIGSKSEVLLLEEIEDSMMVKLVNKGTGDVSLYDVDIIYIDAEYLKELEFNSLESVYWGYKLSDVEKAMKGERFQFTVDSNGNTTYEKIPVYVEDSPNGLLKSLITKIAIGTGVILLCVTLNVLTAGAATPVACFFAGAAHGAITGAAIGALTGAAVGGVIGGLKTGSWEGALEGALTGAADGYMWGAIGGAITGGFSSQACFAEDTPVLTQKGLVPIQNISVGDYVYTNNFQTGDVELKKVLETFENKSSRIVEVVVDGELLKTTYEHPFYVLEKGWVCASELKSGDLVTTKDGVKHVDSATLLNLESQTTVYNISVNGLTYDNCNYFVGKNGVLVHNVCADGVTKTSPQGWVDDAMDITNANPSSFSGTGSYEIRFANGQYYVGKGGASRAFASAKYRADAIGSSYQQIVWRPALNTNQAFYDEAQRIAFRGGIGSKGLINIINSPGAKIILP